LSKRAGMTVSHLSMMENNRRDPSMGAMQALATAFGLPLNVLVFLAAEPRELTGISDELKEKLSRAALDLLGLPTSGHLFSSTPNRDSRDSGQNAPGAPR
jgi:transcriptional regulator with XRE-family HTH domain